MIKSKHNNLFNYFAHNNNDLSKVYVKSCKKFFLTLDDKERIKQENENIKRIDAQTRFKK
jgi:hypothetical protein